MSLRLHIVVLLGIGLFAASAGSASAQTLPPQERMCDPTFEDCRADVLSYIQQETVQIDMAFWMMTDARYSNALVAAAQRGVKIRLLMDPRCGDAHPACLPQLDQLKNAGIPMRNRVTSGILHWKTIIFAGQGQVQFAGANYAPFELSPDTPWVNFTDEIVMFSKDPSIVHSFMTRFDDLWVSTTEFQDYANITMPLVRSYPTSPIDPQLNFPPEDSYRIRSTNAYALEQQGIDVLMFRITDEQQTNAIIAAKNRGIPVRLITDETEYRNTTRLWDSYNVDKMYNAGVQVRVDDHQGIDHAKGIVLKSQGMAIFGSSNWTSPSTETQREHNLFTTQPWIFTWLQNLFNRKWNNTGQGVETKAFVPLPPDAPVYNLPANGATGVATTGVSLSWNAGLWAHNYDIYFGTTPTPPLIESNRYLGPSQYSTDYRYYALPALQPGTRYYWKIVSKTMAFVSADGPVWSFTTAGTAPNNLPPSVTLTSPASGATFTAPATITLTASASDSDGTVAKVEFYSGNSLIGTATASPYTVTWANVPAGQYSLTAVATDNGNATTTSAAVSITVAAALPPPPTLPSGWSHADIGATGATGDATYSNGTYTVTGAGADVWGTADALHYAWRSLTGDGTIVARVASIQFVNNWTKVGVMMRNSTSPSAAQAFMLVAASPVKGAPYQRRTADGNISVSTSGASVTAPYWVKLVRTGSTIAGYESPDGTTWTLVASDTFTLGSTILVGLGVSSHIAGTNATATFDNVTVTAANPIPPTVSLTSPASGASYTAPATINLAATASDADGSVTKVDFYAGSTLLGTSTTTPYAFAWSNVSAGTYSLTAVATDNDGLTTTSSAVSVTVNPAPNNPPTVSLTSPVNGATYTAPATINLAASASDSDGSVTKVDFYAGTTLLGTATASPYAFTWSNVAAGTYSLTAVATDNSGATTTSSAIGITVNAPPNKPPTVSLTSPANGATYTAPATIGLAASASDTDGSVTKVDFYAGATLLGTATASPYAFTWANVAAGTYSLTAVATDNSGATTTSSAIGVTVNAPPNSPPTVSLTSPANGASYTAPATIGLAASASDTDGSVTKVDFYAGATLLGTATAAPYAFTWSNVAAGTYSLTAVATDNSGASTTSSAVSVTVTAAPPPPPPGLPTGWSHADIGATGAAGDSKESNGTFTVTGAGADVWNASDQFQYAWRSLTGDGTIVARVASIQFVNNWTKAGVMMRNSTSPSAAYAFMLVAASPVKGVPFQRRTADGNSAVSTSGSQSTAPRWVKLVRSGNTISGYESADGVNWTLVGSDTFAMGPTILVGLAVSSHVTGTTATCTFDNVTIQ